MTAPEGSCHHGTPFRWQCEDCDWEDAAEQSIDGAARAAYDRAVVKGGQGHSPHDLTRNWANVIFTLAVCILSATLFCSIVKGCAELSPIQNQQAPEKPR